MTDNATDKPPNGLAPIQDTSSLAVTPGMSIGMALTPSIDGFMVQDIVTREMSEVICPYVKQLKTVKQIETEEDYIKACNDLARLKRRSRRRGGTDLADVVQGEWRNALRLWRDEIKGDKKKWKTQKSKYHRDMTVIFVKILCAVKYTNMYHLAHSKLKLDNILFHAKEDAEIVQVIAFNYQIQQPKITRAETPASTAFSSPESIFFKRDRRLTYPTYNIEKDDVWQLGCIIFMMLAHQLPYEAGSACDPNFRHATSGSFSNKKDESGEKHCLKKLLKFYKVLPMFNDDAIDLLVKIFRPEADRIELDDIFHHPWLKKELEELSETGELDWFEDTLDGIMRKGAHPKPRNSVQCNES